MNPKTLSQPKSGNDTFTHSTSQKQSSKTSLFRLHRDTPSGVSYHLTSQTATLQTTEKHLLYAQITPLKNPLFIFLTMKKYFPNDAKKHTSKMTILTILTLLTILLQSIFIHTSQNKP